MLYKDKNRKVGSQSEVPCLNFEKDKINVTGYQHYSIQDGQLTPYVYVNKFNDLKKFLSEHKEKSLADIGCSSGLSSFIADIAGYEAIMALDHDQEYLTIVEKIASHLNKTNIIASKYSFGDIIEPVDTVVMFAIIHWIYSCTATFGNFKKIFNYIKTICNKYLIIEWVDNCDSAMKAFNHINYNKNIHTEEYNLANFEREVNEFGTVLYKFEVRLGRTIYYVQKK